jgi:hypothetical protein
MILETNENFEQLDKWGTPTGSERDETEFKPLFSVKGIEWRLNNLLGNILTTVDAAITDPVQRKAMKDIMKRHTYELMTEVRNEAYNPSCSQGVIGESKEVQNIA